MKRLSIYIVTMLLVFVVNAQQVTEKVEVSVNGKIMVKSSGRITNQSNLSALSTSNMRTRLSKEFLAIHNKMYLLNTDQELKEALKKAFPAKILDTYKMEKMFLQLDVNPDGHIYCVTFVVNLDSPLYDMDMQIYSDLEDIIKSTFRFKIPDTSISSYPDSQLFFLSRLTDEASLFPPAAYRERTGSHSGTTVSYNELYDLLLKPQEDYFKATFGKP